MELRRHHPNAKLNRLGLALIPATAGGQTGAAGPHPCHKNLVEPTHGRNLQREPACKNRYRAAYVASNGVLV